MGRIMKKGFHRQCKHGATLVTDENEHGFLYLGKSACDECPVIPGPESPPRRKEWKFAFVYEPDGSVTTSWDGSNRTPRDILNATDITVSEKTKQLSELNPVWVYFEARAVYEAWWNRRGDEDENARDLLAEDLDCLLPALTGRYKELFEEWARELEEG